MYTYAQVEDALATVHRIPPNARGAFRGRIRHFQKLGIVTSTPGRGRRIDYSVYDVLLWGFALELGEFGVDPTAVKKIVFSRPIEILFSVFDQSAKESVLFFFHPNLLSNSFPDTDRQSMDNPWGSPNSFNGIFAPDLPSLNHKLGKMASDFNARLGMINIGRMRQRINIALDAVVRVKAR